MSDHSSLTPVKRTLCNHEASGCEGMLHQKACGACEGATSCTYWCETCKKFVPDKRCNSCGLKARKVRQPG